MLSEIKSEPALSGKEVTPPLLIYQYLLVHAALLTNGSELSTRIIALIKLGLDDQTVAVTLTFIGVSLAAAPNSVAQHR